MAKVTQQERPTEPDVTVELSYKEARALTALLGKCDGNTFDSLWYGLSNVVGRNVSKAFDIAGTTQYGETGVQLFSISVKDVGYPVTQ